MSWDCPRSAAVAVRKYKQQNCVCHIQKELNKATEIKSTRGDGEMASLITGVDLPLCGDTSLKTMLQQN
jgi:hypothetical protein